MIKHYKTLQNTTKHIKTLQNMYLLPGDILPQQLVESTVASEHQGSIHRLDDPLSQAIQIRTDAHGSASDVGQGENVLRNFPDNSRDPAVQSHNIPSCSWCCCILLREYQGYEKGASWDQFVSCGWFETCTTHVTLSAIKQGMTLQYIVCINQPARQLASQVCTSRKCCEQSETISACKKHVFSFS